MDFLSNWSNKLKTMNKDKEYLLPYQLEVFIRLYNYMVLDKDITIAIDSTGIKVSNRERYGRRNITMD